MATSIYSPELWDSLEPANVRGGKRRNETGKRDLLGRYLPNDPIKALYVELDPEHGRAGGVTLLAKRGREYFSEIAKIRWIKALQNKDQRK